MDHTPFRYIIRDGKLILQYAIWVYDLNGNKTNEVVYQNVPVVGSKDE